MAPTRQSVNATNYAPSPTPSSVSVSAPNGPPTPTTPSSQQQQQQQSSERKRKPPARTSSRLDQVAAKRRNAPVPADPSQKSQLSPSPPPVVPLPAPAAVLPSPAPLPTSLPPGASLPAVDNPQPEDLSGSEYQSTQESGVAAESLLRSRQKWMAEGLYERYWAKPSRKKGAVSEEPNNPAKESMTKLGPAVITLEPHVFDVVLYAVKNSVKNPKPLPVPHATAAFRPIIQYGPAGGSMLPPPSSTPAQTPVQTPAQLSVQTPTQTPVLTPVPTLAPVPAPVRVPPVSAAASPTTVNSVATPSPILNPDVARRLPPHPLTQHVTHGSPLPASRPTVLASPARSTAPGLRPPSTLSPGASRPAPLSDPIIMILAEKAAENPRLRDIMKRVAAHLAPPEETAFFQSVIDQITAEYGRKGGSNQPPSALGERMLVDGRTVKYYADEVKSILEIVLTSNPQQKSTDLRPPAGSGPLVVRLVKAALDDFRTREIIRRIADGRPGLTDSADLKAILDRLYRTSQPLTTPAVNGGGSSPRHLLHQAVRSKGLAQTPPQPTALKLDVTAIVFEFVAGNGDRFLFPKFSIVEFLAGRLQAIVSFLIVRRGSAVAPGIDASPDPALDFYQPVTMRVASRHLEYLGLVVAPADEVRRYMDHVMDTMTRGEYVLLAMRLPRSTGRDSRPKSEEVATAASGTTIPVPITGSAPAATLGQAPDLASASASASASTARSNGSNGTTEPALQSLKPKASVRPVMWTIPAATTAGSKPRALLPLSIPPQYRPGYRHSDGEDEDDEDEDDANGHADADAQAKYHNFVHSITAREPEMA